jgi:RNA polymerase sigma factor (sigma-70 family)
MTDEASSRVVLERLIRDEWPKLRRFFRTKVPDTDAYDLVQATMLAFVEKMPEARDAKAYLWGIARKQVLRYYERSRVALSFDSTLHSVLEAERTLSSRLDDRQRLIAALQQLPADHQMAYELRYGEELSLDEVASALDVSLSTAKRYIAAAEAKLTAILGSDVATVPAAYTSG